jgi:hypothetical protein
MLTRKTALLISMTAVLGLSAALFAQSATAPQSTGQQADRFTFTVVDAQAIGSSVTQPLEVVIKRWSTDADRDRMFSILTQGGADNLPDALREAYEIGYLHWPGGLDYIVRYARRNPRPDGAQDIVLVTDRSMWTWWRPAGAQTSNKPFTVIQIRMNAEGVGEGKLSLGTKVAANKETGVALADYASQPVLMTDVRRARATS